MIVVPPTSVPPAVRGVHTEDDLAAALSWASGQVEAYCEREFGFVEDDVVTVSPLRDRTAWLPNPPVVAVTEVEAWLPRNGAMVWIEIDNYQCTPDGMLYDAAGLPGVSYECPSWPVLPNSLRVTYTHGFADIPQPVIDAVISAAAAYLADPSRRLAQKTIDDVSYRWFESSDSPVDCALLSKYRLVSIA